MENASCHSSETLPHLCALDPKYRHRNSRGFSLIEVLVSIVVLTFGMLGVVGMQSAALRSNTEARLQSTGIVLARELADTIRGNKAIGILTGTSNPFLVDLQSPLIAPSASYCLNVASGTCTTNTDVANAQLTEWLARVQAELPGARVKSCYDTTPYDSTTGLPQWACTAGAGAAIVIKIGWTRGSTDKSQTGAAAIDRTTDTGSVPSIVMPVTAGV